MEDELIQVWIIHHIQIVGEAAGKISASIQERNPDIPWHDIGAMRNILVHHYFGIDLQEVWNTVTIDLPVLKSHVRGIPDALGS